MKEKAVQVLLVEDNEQDAQLIRHMFKRERPGSFELTHLSRMGEALARLAQGGVDIVLLDMGLPDGHGLDTVRRARRPRVCLSSYSRAWTTRNWPWER